ncbi:hypothetical protein BPS10C_064 [Bacillus phage BPS10C]|uniref:Uncharacterized protein n=1 Tax=Bacillus phage BPS10C TaxID=1277886 RepID=W5QU77_9CAUD|nr:hypothetical protein BPS10C_064 [Bacillus phage BPS10C]AGI12061.1 hypothetical protein BPS10C_064 [Bacillus phage BPS10C]
MITLYMIATLIVMGWGVKVIWDMCEDVITDPDPPSDAQVVYIIVLVILVSFMEIGLSGLLAMFWSMW